MRGSGGNADESARLQPDRPQAASRGNIRSAWYDSPDDWGSIPGSSIQEELRRRPSGNSEHQLPPHVISEGGLPRSPPARAVGRARGNAILNSPADGSSSPSSPSNNLSEPGRNGQAHRQNTTRKIDEQGFGKSDGSPQRTSGVRRSIHVDRPAQSSPSTVDENAGRRHSAPPSSFEDDARGSPAQTQSVLHPVDPACGHRDGGGGHDGAVAGEFASDRPDNILCAVLALVKELDVQGLELVRRAVEQRSLEFQ